MIREWFIRKPRTRKQKVYCGNCKYDMGWCQHPKNQTERTSSTFYSTNTTETIRHDRSSMFLNGFNRCKLYESKKDKDHILSETGWK